MKSLSSDILNILKSTNKEEVSVSSMLPKLTTSNRVRVTTELDLLHDGGYIEIVRSEKGKIKKASITDKGRQYFYEGDKSATKDSIQAQIDELKEAVDLLNRALNAKTGEERKGIITKLDSLQSVLNGAYDIYEKVGRFI